MDNRFFKLLSLTVLVFFTVSFGIFVADVKANYQSSGLDLKMGDFNFILNQSLLKASAVFIVFIVVYVVDRRRNKNV